jgi:hypothetical protein
MQTTQDAAADLNAYASEILESDQAISCHCVVITGHSACHADSEFSWSFDDKDPDAIRRFIGALEEIKAHALKTLIDAASEVECKKCGDFYASGAGCVCQVTIDELRQDLEGDHEQAE